jgi:hypothetical protein
VVFLPEGFAASAIEVDGGDGCHGLKREQGNNTKERGLMAPLSQSVTKTKVV